MTDKTPRRDFDPLALHKAYYRGAMGWFLLSLSLMAGCHHQTSKSDKPTPK